MRRRVPLAEEAIFAVIELVDRELRGRCRGRARVGVTGLGVSHGMCRSRVMACDTIRHLGQIGFCRNCISVLAPMRRYQPWYFGLDQPRPVRRRGISSTTLLCLFFAYQFTSSTPHRVISGDSEGVGTCKTLSIAHVSSIRDARRGYHASASF